MLISEEALTHWIDTFYGYGSWQARIWFVAYEEGGGDLPEEVAEKLAYFSQVHAMSTEATLCDIREMYRHVNVRLEGPKARLFSDRYEYRFGSHAALNGVWKNLIAFVHGYRNQNLPDLLEYQRSSFTSLANASEALVRLYPLPSPHNHAWYYSWLDMPKLPFLKRRGLYEEQVYEHRMHSILRNVKIHKPEVVLMYGMNNINRLKESVQVAFPAVEFKMVKAVRQQIPQHHRADFEGTTLLITTQIPALRHNRPETGFDWEAFGRRVAE